MATTAPYQFADTRVAAEGRHDYGIVRGSLNGLGDAIRRRGKVEWLLWDEEVAAFAAAALLAFAAGLLAAAIGARPFF
jgi:hypothetical protein